MSGLPRAPSVRLVRGVHLVMPALPVDEALLLSSNDDKRVVFLIPWYGRTLLGTTDTDFAGDPGQVRVEPDDVEYLLGRANRVLGGSPWHASDIVGEFAGLRTLPRTHDLSPTAVSREWTLSEPRKGLLASVGGKFTSARADAAAIVNRALRRMGRDPVPCPTVDRPFPWCPPAPFDAWMVDVTDRGRALGLDDETANHCALRYGLNVDRLFEQIVNEPQLARRIVSDAPFCMAEIVHSVAGEMALDLDDILRRRIPLSILDRLPETTVREVAEIAGHLLGWSKEQCAAEVESLVSHPAREVFS